MAQTLSPNELKKFQEQALGQIARAASRDSLEALRLEVLGRKSKLNSLLHGLAQMNLEEKRVIGSLANEIKHQIAAAIDRRETELRRAELSMASDDPSWDRTLPGSPWPPGSRHPLMIAGQKILQVFEQLGFIFSEGPEIESDEHNFTLLNIPPDHPARDMHDTLYLGEKWLLRTHTTPFWIPVMKEGPPPYRHVTMGKVFRREAIDATHLPVFHQIDAFAVDRDLSLADLKATLETWAMRLFGAGTEIRFRPSYFPFTEPSCEVEIRCFRCRGRGCATCGNGWLEMLGAGMIHPSILERLGHDPQEWRGYAFGLGLERVAMVLWGIPDIRLLYENNINFLEQFSTPI